MDYIAAIDVGTTNLKCQIFSPDFRVMGSSIQKINMLKPFQGWEEISPNELQNGVKQVLQNALKDADLKSNNIKSLGLSTQRNTFITWNKKTGEHYHNFITWGDSRSNIIVKELNKSITFKIVKYISKILYLIFASKQLKVAKSFTFSNIQILPKLLWLLQNNRKFRQDMKNNEVQFGTLDTWLLYQASNGKLHVTDVSCASATGLFNLFTMSWMPNLMFQYFGITNTILPSICNTNLLKYLIDNNITCKISNITIACSLADQSASLYGTGSFSKYTAKVTMGTGMFLDINCGPLPEVCLGYFPLVSWTFNEDICFSLEAVDYNSGSLIQLAKSIGGFNNTKELNMLKQGNELSTNSLLFVLPESEPSKSVRRDYSFIGVTTCTTKSDMAISILESFAFRIKKILDNYHNEMPQMKLNTLWVDGGVSRNDYICQTIANVTSTTVVRMKNSNRTEVSCLGAAFMAGLSSGVWKNKRELENFRNRTDQKFVPDNNNYFANEYKYIRWLYNQKCLY
ncbi:putative glycerol kinase 5 [Rhopalosiphum maidis]|uniref:putative glycerol kinase 5 n=1 Tax=Rhopalosiphum maidis TaxID=43146 RepID=UPI000F00A0C7|nr:putative glycerol kinase 5 [Rhopalosiphum maidis]XP_026815063.1 putative glycerol kinase 5 [Rhopalosiphum maidis]XP_026815064.1 putative glycerol kinase 5 [Rhopalosiphum maidis]